MEKVKGRSGSKASFSTVSVCLDHGADRRARKKELGPGKVLSPKKSISLEERIRDKEQNYHTSTSSHKCLFLAQPSFQPSDKIVWC